MTPHDLRRIKRHLKDAIRAYDHVVTQRRAMPGIDSSDVGTRTDDELNEAMRDADALITLIDGILEADTTER